MANKEEVKWHSHRSQKYLAETIPLLGSTCVYVLFILLGNISAKQFVRCRDLSKKNQEINGIESSEIAGGFL